MFRLVIQPSSGQLTIEQDLLCAHNMGSHISAVYQHNVSVDNIIRLLLLHDETIIARLPV